MTVLLGPRHCGKATLARQLRANGRTEFFDLEDPSDASRLENPTLTLDGVKGLVVIDAAQEEGAAGMTDGPRHLTCWAFV